MEKIKETVETVCSFLNEEGTDYVLVGGVAVMVHGRPRSTMDIDFILQLSDADIEALSAFLQEEGFDADSEEIKRAFGNESHVSVFVDGAFRLDLKGVYTPLDRRSLEDRTFVEMDGVEIAVAPPEHTIAAKLAYGSERDLEDAESIYRRQEDIDHELLESLAETAGSGAELGDFLDRVQGN